MPLAIPTRGPRAVTFAVIAAIVLTGLTLWGLGGLGTITRWAAGQQREVQGGLARALRALQGGHAGATLALWGACFTYGVVHAVGPGHGKLVLGTYGMGATVPLRRMTLLALASSLLQGITAIALVLVAVWLLGWGRDGVTGMAEDRLAPISLFAFFLIGWWLAWRGLRRAYRLLEPEHVHTAACGDGCGHAHGPTPDQAAQVGTWREAAVLIASIGVRPCSGALLVLVLGWQLGILPGAIGGVLAMSLGTAIITGGVGALSTVLRSGLGAVAARTAGLSLLALAVELTASAVLIIISARLFVAAVS